MPLDVLHFHRNYHRTDVGGVESYLRSLCESLRGRARFQILTDRKAGQPARERYPEADVHRVDPARAAGSALAQGLDLLLNEPARERARAKLYEELEYEVLHLHGPLTYSNTVATGPLFLPLYSLQAWTRVRKPVLFTFHGNPEVILRYHHPNPLLRPYFNLWKLIERRNLQKASKVIVVDRYAYLDYRARPYVDPAKLVFLLNGVDLKAFRPFPKERAVRELNRRAKLSLDPSLPTLAYLNRLAKDKGVEHLLHLASRLKGEYNLLVTGTGPYRTAIERLARENPSVKYLGPVPQEWLPLVLNSADLAFNPTLNPGALRVNLESIATHTPVLTYDGGDRYPTEHGRTGWLYRSLDEMVSFAQGLVDTGELPFETPERDCAEAKKKFDLRRISGKVLSLYRELAEAG
jgi:glycosyltransferase involved in cell wall biosynthesis